MALNLLYSIRLNETVTDGGGLGGSGGGAASWNIGDIINSYWDDVSLNFEIQRNGTKITSGFDLTGYDITRTNYNYQFCDGTNRIYFTQRSVYPYVRKRVEYDSATCQSFVCDLQIELTSTTMPTNNSNNGQIIVTATTSQTNIKYALQPFLFNDAIGSPSGTFSNLYAGTYTVYARDDKNCSSEIVVELEDQSTYALLYKLEFDDLQGTEHKFHIFERGYTGASSFLVGGSNPAQYSMSDSGVEDLFDRVLKPSSVTLNIVCETNFQYDSLFTQDDRKYKLIWSVGGVQKWTGFLMPSVFSESYEPTPYEISLTFIDGLALLDRKKFVIDDNLGRYWGKRTLIDVIGKALNKTGQSLPLRSAVNMYSTEMSNSATSDPLKQARVNCETFYRGTETNIEYSTCAEVIEGILKPFGAVLFQAENAWHIVRVPEFRNSSIDYRQYSITSSVPDQFLTNNSLSPSVSMSSASTNRFIMDRSGSYREIYPAYGRITVVNELNKINLIRNGDFADAYIRDDDFEYFFNWNFVGNNGSVLGQGLLNGDSFAAIANTTAGEDCREDYIRYGGTIQLSGIDKFRLSFDYGFDKITTIIPFTIIEIELSMTLTDDLDENNTQTYYLTESGVMTTTQTRARFYPKPQGGFSNLSVDFVAPADFVENATGTFQLKIFNYSTSNPQIIHDPAINYNQSISTMANLDVSNKPIGYKIDLKDVFYNAEFRRYYELKKRGTGETVDYDGYYFVRSVNDSNFYWELIYSTLANPYTLDNGETYIAYIDNELFYINSVNLEQFLKGDSVPTKETLVVKNDQNYLEEKEYTLTIADVPQRFNRFSGNFERLVNDKNLYDDYFVFPISGADQPITTWKRDSLNENPTTIQKIFAKVVARQFRTPTLLLSVKGTTLEDGNGGSLYIYPNNTIKDTFDSNKIYYIDGLNMAVKYNDYDLNLIEIKQESSSDFNEDFSNDFGGTLEEKLG